MNDHASARSARGSPLTPSAEYRLGQYQDFRIAPQPLASALDAFSAATGIGFRLADVALDAKRSPGVEGNYSVIEGITMLLGGSGIVPAWEGDALLLRAASVFAAHAGEALCAAWDKYYRAIGEAREVTERGAAFQDPRDRAKGYHALIEAQAFAYNFAIAPRLDKPRIYQLTSWQSDVFTLGLNNPDGHYGMTFLDGKLSYRIRGRLGQVNPFLLQVFTNLMGPADAKVIGNYAVADDFAVDADGRFEIVVSATRHDGDWIALDPVARYQWIMIRRNMGDCGDDPGELEIEAMDVPGADYLDREEFDEAAFAERVDRAAEFLRFLVANWNVGIYDMILTACGGKTNQMTLAPGTSVGQVGSPASNYALGIYEVAEDEALIIEVAEPPKTAAYWNLQLADVWSRSIEFSHHQSTLNMRQAVIDADGVFRAVAAWRDPGVANWLDTVRHAKGVIIFRNYSAKTAPVPTLRRVKLDVLREYLPPGTAMVSADERRRVLQARRRGMLKLLGE